MAEAPKRAWLIPRVGPGFRVIGWDSGRWTCKLSRQAVHAAEFTRADIADGYREALVALLHPSGDGVVATPQDIERAWKALAKGDEA